MAEHPEFRWPSPPFASLPWYLTPSGSGSSLLRPFARDPDRWKHERARVRRELEFADELGAQPGARYREELTHVYERTSWGWLRWNALAEAEQRPAQIGFLPPSASRAARLAWRRVSRRTPLTVWAVAGRQVSFSLGQMLTVLACLLAGLSAMVHGLPFGVGVPLMLLGVALAEAVPRWLDGLAHRYVRIIDHPRHLAYMERMAFLHVQVSEAAATSQLPELGHVARLGHRMLWDAAGLLSEASVELLRAYETTYTTLAQQAAETRAPRRTWIEPRSEVQPRTAHTAGRARARSAPSSP